MLWIRSQNKDILVCCSNLFIDYFCEDYGIKTTSHKGIFRLGVYSTEEKAKKVLDLITLWVDGQTNEKIEEFASGYNQVFQMPKDDEVEENEPNS